MNEKIALVLCGGGSKGAIEVGLYRSLTEQGIQIDFIVGSSIGAVNGAFIASGISPAKLADMWRNLKIRNLYGFNWDNLWKFFRSDSLYSHRPFRRFLEQYLPLQTFEELKVPLIVTCTNLQTGEPVYIRHGNLLDTLMASVAMPGLFPPQSYQGIQLVDGSVSEDVPLELAISEGATTVLAMQYNCCPHSGGPLHGLVMILIRAFSIALDRKTKSDVRHFGSRSKLIIFKPTFGSDIDLLDFRHTNMLIEKAYEFSKKTLEKEFSHQTQQIRRE